VTDIGKAHRTDRLSAVATSTDGIHVLTVAGEIDHDTAPP
jgi:anti-anti-sigma regulatory factor